MRTIRDAPCNATLERFRRDHDPSIVWKGHAAGRERGHCRREKLHGLDALPDHGFTVICTPMKVQRASARWTRAVVLVDEGRAP